MTTDEFIVKGKALGKFEAIPEDFVFGPKIAKSKIYLKPGEKPPEGIRVQRGSRGGTYYETKIKVKAKKPLSDERGNEYLSSLKEHLEAHRTFEKKSPAWKEYHYKGMVDFIISNATSKIGNETFTPDEHSIIKKYSVPPELHACYKNSVLFVLGAMYSKNDVDIKYVEGYAWREDLIPLEHAWITINGKVFDTTWEEQERTVYFGVPFSPDEVYDMHINKERKTSGMINVSELDFPYLKTKRKYPK